MELAAKILISIGSSEPSDFNEFCRELGDDKPDNKTDWAILFKTLEFLEASGLVEVERSGTQIDTLVLTDLGAERAREVLRAR